MSKNTTAKSVTGNASRQARFAEKQRQAGRVKLTLWASTEDAAAIRQWLVEREKQRSAVAKGKTAPVAPVGTLLMPKTTQCRTVIFLSRPEPALLILKSADYDKALAPILKSMRGFLWKNPLWERKLTDIFTPADDQAVEVGVKLLKAGYAVSITDDVLKVSAESFL